MLYLNAWLELMLIAIAIGATELNFKKTYYPLWWTPEMFENDILIVLIAALFIECAVQCYLEVSTMDREEEGDAAYLKLVKSVEDLTSQIARYDIYLELDMNEGKTFTGLLESFMEERLVLEEEEALLVEMEQKEELVRDIAALESEAGAVQADTEEIRAGRASMSFVQRVFAWTMTVPFAMAAAFTGADPAC